VDDATSRPYRVLISYAHEPAEQDPTPARAKFLSVLLPAQLQRAGLSLGSVVVVGIGSFLGVWYAAPPVTCRFLAGRGSTPMVIYWTFRPYSGLVAVRSFRLHGADRSLALRRQLAVLLRRTARPRMHWPDLAVISTLTRMLPPRRRIRVKVRRRGR
jgi:hypothetical protein